VSFLRGGEPPSVRLIQRQQRDLRPPDRKKGSCRSPPAICTSTTWRSARNGASLGRTITEADVVNFAGPVRRLQPHPHRPPVRRPRPPFRRPIAHGLLVFLGRPPGWGCTPPPMRTMAILAIKEWQLPATPVFIRRHDPHRPGKGPRQAACAAAGKPRRDPPGSDSSSTRTASSSWRGRPTLTLVEGARQSSRRPAAEGKKEPPPRGGGPDRRGSGVRGSGGQRRRTQPFLFTPLPSFC